MFQHLRLTVFFGPLIVLLTGVLASLVDLASFLAFVSSINEWILTHFSVLFNWGSFGFVLTCIWVWFSPLGKIRIGGEQAKPLLSKWSWFSITLCTTIAIGILFWATAEPLYHVYEPPASLGLASGSEGAQRFAMSSLFMHWSFTPYAIYTVPSLAFALAYYNLGKSYSLNGPLSLVWKPFSRPFAKDLIDAIALFALVAGISANLGVGILSISGGISGAFGIASGPLVMGMVAVSIVFAFAMSSVTGLMRGIRYLSDINIRFFMILCVALLIFGPTLSIIEAGLQGLADYAAEFIPRSIGVGAIADKEWAQDWTSFYWANWLAWAPITALFLGRIARGYTVREFITVNLILPAFFSIAWMSIFGASAIEIDMQSGGSLYSGLQENGPESVIYKLFDALPYSGIWAIFFVILSFICFVTAADSNTEAIASVCQKTDEDVQTLSGHSSKPVLRLKIVWASVIGATAWIMVTFSGVDGVRMLSNLGGLPALFIVLLMNMALILMATRYFKLFKSGSL